jgi:hypothetical protein
VTFRFAAFVARAFAMCSALGRSIADDSEAADQERTQ